MRALLGQKKVCQTLFVQQKLNVCQGHIYSCWFQFLLALITWHSTSAAGLLISYTCIQSVTMPKTLHIHTLTRNDSIVLAPLCLLLLSCDSVECVLIFKICLFVDFFGGLSAGFLDLNFCPACCDYFCASVELSLFFDLAPAWQFCT